MCAASATSREHVPPQCLFPEAREAGGRNYRRNLITVPSCEVHNTRKSDDDEFLMLSLAGIIGNNSVGYRHKLTKGDRALRRSSYRHLSKVFQKWKDYELKREGDLALVLSWGTPDVPRLLRCFDKIARALYFHHFGTRFEGEINSHLGYLENTDANASEFTRFLQHRVEVDLRGKEPHGQNPDVFYYQVSDPDQFGLFIYHLRFYGGLPVYCGLAPATAQKPGNLPMLLIEKGIRTVLALEGKEYHFNVAK
jgi:hypothetical protein